MLNYWVKNVYYLGKYYGKMCVLFYTEEYKISSRILDLRGKGLFIPQKMTVLSALVSPKNYVGFNLLFKYLYPFSTAPTITITNKILRISHNNRKGIIWN